MIFGPNTYESYDTTSVTGKSFVMNIVRVFANDTYYTRDNVFTLPIYTVDKNNNYFNS